MVLRSKAKPCATTTTGLYSCDTLKRASARFIKHCIISSSCVHTVVFLVSERSGLEAMLTDICSSFISLLSMQ
eukprot:13582-Heterococcus_DN1.PRE.1